MKIDKSIPNFENLVVGDIYFLESEGDSIMLLKKSLPAYLRRNGWVYHCRLSNGKVVFEKGKQQILFKI